MAEKKTCFIIGPIGDPGSEERTWADKIRKYIIEPAVINCGYEKPVRADDPSGNVIMIDVIEQMFDADLVIADLTNHNANAYYELGIRHCAQKPSIHLIKADQMPRFDLSANQAIFIDTDADVVEKAKADIITRIKAIETNPDQFHSQVHLQITMKKLQLFKKQGETVDGAILDSLHALVGHQIGISDMVRILHDELVVKPRTIPTSYIELSRRANPDRRSDY